MPSNELFGLILAGGKSTRMGRPKVEVEVEGQTLLNHQIEVLSGLVERTIVSTNNTLPITLEQVKDENQNLGPLGGLISILRKYPDRSFLVIPIDIYPLGKEDLKILIEKRDMQKDISCFGKAGLIEPFPLIMETSFLPILEKSISKNKLSLIGAIKSSNFNAIPYHTNWTNLNSPQDLAQFS